MRVARTVGSLLAVLGLALLAVAAAHVATGVRAQRGADAFPGPMVVPQVAPRATESAAPQMWEEGEAIGRLRIPRLGLDSVVFEGASSATLRKGPGHVAGSAWLGGSAVGNCVIAGHRDSFFRSLRQAREGDLVVLADAYGVRRYRLESRRVVKPDEVSVAAATPDARLTLITCYPFRWIGAAPLRLVWSASALPPAQAAASSLGAAQSR